MDTPDLEAKRLNVAFTQQIVAGQVKVALALDIEDLNALAVGLITEHTVV